MKIGIMADCQTRLLDELARLDETGRLNASYLRKQLVHLGQAYEQACGLVMQIEEPNADFTAVFLDGFTEAEIVHLGTGRLGAAAKGGEA